MQLINIILVSLSLTILSSLLERSTIVNLYHHPSTQATIPFQVLQCLSIILPLAPRAPFSRQQLSDRYKNPCSKPFHGS